MIIGDAVNLRPFDLGDADFLFEWMNDPEYTGIFEPFEAVTKEELEEWLPREKSGIQCYIIETKSGEKVGQIVVRLQDGGSYQIGYRVILPARGQGACTNAVLTLTSHLFASGVRHIIAEVNPGNTPSIRVLERAGFRKTVYKERAIEVNGVWLDGVVYELRR